MKQLEKGQDKIQAICTALREETLEPARDEAARIIDEGKAQAEKIIAEAETERERLIEEGHEAVRQQKSVFESNLSQAVKQSVQTLRHEIEASLFGDEASTLVQESSADPALVSKLIEAVVNAIETHGTGADLTVFVPRQVSADSVNKLIGERVKNRLKDGGVTVGSFAGGAKVKLNEQRVILDISDTALQELLESYVRKDFREKLFGSTER